MATRRLYVLRHAKSSWDDPGQRDHERPLAPSGRRATDVLRRHLSDGGIEAALVLCSSARRAIETLEGVNPAGGRRSIERGLYGAGAGELLERLREIPGDVSSVLLIGHNPAVQALILRLADGGDAGDDQSDLALVRRKFPTGSLATLEFDRAWNEIGPGDARLVALVRPKQLAGG